MENGENIKKNSLFNASLTYGVLTAIGLIMIALMVYLFDLTGVRWISYLSYIVLLAGIILGTIKYRNDDLGGFISFGKAFGFGTLVSVFAAFISGLFMYIFYQYLAPDAMEQIRQATEEAVINANPNVTDQELDLILRFTSPLVMFISGLFFTTLIGAIFSLVTAAFIKKTNPEEL